MRKPEQDLRVRKTRKALLHGLARLLREKEFSKITVSAICREAEVDRATFYRHFEGKEDLIERGTDQLVDEIVKRIGADSLESPGFPNRLNALFQEIRRQQELFKAFLDRNANCVLANRLSQSIETFLSSERIAPRARQTGASDFEAAMASRMTAAALVSAIQLWVSSYGETPPEAVQKLYERYVTAGVAAVLERGEIVEPGLPGPAHGSSQG